MTSKISTDPLIGSVNQTAFWSFAEEFFDRAIPLAPLDRFDWTELSKTYVLSRKDRNLYKIDEMKQRLPRALRGIPLGQTEIDILGSLLYPQTSICLQLEGTRGAGKTSLLHYIEAACLSVHIPIVFFILDFSAPNIVIDKQLLVDLLHRETTRPDRPGGPNFPEKLSQVGENLKTLVFKGGRVRLTNDFCNAFRPLEGYEIVFVFDNLDHLARTCLRQAVLLARETHLCTDFSTIMCVRPNSIEGLRREGNARNFFQSWVEVRPPHVECWLDKVAERFHDEVLRSSPTAGQDLRLDGRPVDPSDLKNFLSKFFGILKTKRLLGDDVFRRRQVIDDDVLMLMQVLAADDTRHLRQLVRRLLAHPTLPTELLFRTAQCESADIWKKYHPLPAMIEGPRSPFQHDNFVPNLLYFSRGNDSIDFLLPQRILTFLSDTELVDTVTLLLWLDTLGHEEYLIQNCLQMLHVDLLIRGSDTTFIDKDTFPEELFLTDAGKLYKNSMLRNPDYLATVIFDVPLEHKKAREILSGASGDGRIELGFTERVLSLLEYVEEVFRQEQAQIRALHREAASPKLRRVADRLRKGGLFCEELRDALDIILRRSGASRSASVRDLLPLVEEKRDFLSGFVDRSRNQLDTIVNKANKYKSSSCEEYIQRIPHTDIEVMWTDMGDDVVVRLRDLKTYNQSKNAIAVIEMWDQYHQAHVKRAVPLQTYNKIMETHFCVEGASAQNIRLIGSQCLWLSNYDRRLLRSGAHSFPRAWALLSAKIVDTLIYVEFYVIGKTLRQGIQWGRKPTLEKARALASSSIQAVGRRATDMNTRIRRFDVFKEGSAIASELLSPEGLNYLGECVGYVSVCILFMPPELRVLPWEWLAPRATHPEDKPKMLCEFARIIRCTTAPESFGARDQSRDDNIYGHNRGVMCTFGLPLSDGASWRLPTPASYEELIELARGYDTIHIVGHHGCGQDASGDDSEPYIAIDSTIETSAGRERGLTLRLRDVLAQPFARRDVTVIISACEGGSTEGVSNIPAEIAHNSGCQVWATMTKIVRNDVDRLDNALGNEGDDICIDEFIESMRNISVVGHLYVRYGL